MSEIVISNYTCHNKAITRDGRVAMGLINKLAFKLQGEGRVIGAVGKSHCNHRGNLTKLSYP